MKGYANKIAYIDLRKREVSQYKISDSDRKKYIGGKILAAKIIYDLCPRMIDPFEEKNPIVIMTGPFTGNMAPSSSRFNTSTFSPLTGLVTSSNCGGNFGLNLKKAGFDGIIIVGKSKTPVHIKIENGTIEFVDATPLWGKLTSHAQELLGPRSVGKFVIGPAGENLVKYAAVVSEERVAGRNGVGAIFGDKKIKAITATGNFKAEVHKEDKYKKFIQGWIKTLRSHPITGKQLPTYGTAGLVAPMQQRNLLATKNYKHGKFSEFDAITGEHLTEKYLKKNKGCITCPIQCARVVTVEEKEVKGPEVETLALLGSNLQNSDTQKILDTNYYCDEYGIDTISFGSTVGFAMELGEKGLMEFPYSFGDKNMDLVELVKLVSAKKNIGADLAEGTRFMAEKYGGKEFAINVKGLELAAYEPRGAQGMGLGYATSNRGGCHLNAGYMVVMEGLGLDINAVTTRGKAGFTVFFQDLMEAISAAGACLFTSYAVLPPIMIKNPNNIIVRSVTKIIPFFGGTVGFLTKHLGILSINIGKMIPYPKALNLLCDMKLNIGSFVKAGRRGYNIERMINIRQGLDPNEDTLPKRLTDEKQPENGQVVRLEDMLKSYYKIRNWPKGKVADKEIKKLGI